MSTWNSWLSVTSTHMQTHFRHHAVPVLVLGVLMLFSFFTFIIAIVAGVLVASEEPVAGPRSCC